MTTAEPISSTAKTAHRQTSVHKAMMNSESIHMGMESKGEGLERDQQGWTKSSQGRDGV